MIFSTKNSVQVHLVAQEALPHGHGVGALMRASKPALHATPVVNVLERQSAAPTLPAAPSSPSSAKTGAKWDFSPRVAADALLPRRRLETHQKAQLAQREQTLRTRLVATNPLDAALNKLKHPQSLIEQVVQASRFDVQLSARAGSAQERAATATEQHLLDEMRIESGLSPEQVQTRRQTHTRIAQEQRHGAAGSGSGHVLKSAGHGWAANVYSLAEDVAQVAGAQDFAQFQRTQRQAHQDTSGYHHERAIEAGRIVKWEQVSQEGEYAPQRAANATALQNGVAYAHRLGEYIENLYLQSAPYLLESLGGGIAGRTVAGGLKLGTRAVSRAGLLGAAAVSLPSSSGRVLDAQREHSQALHGKEETHLPAALALGGVSAAVNAVLGVDRMLAGLSTTVLNPARLVALPLLGKPVVAGAVQVGAVTAGEAVTEVVQGLSERTGAKVASDKLEFFSLDYGQQVLGELRDGGLMGWAGGSVGQGIRAVRASTQEAMEWGSGVHARMQATPRIVDGSGRVLYEEERKPEERKPQRGEQEGGSSAPAVVWPAHLPAPFGGNHAADSYALGWHWPTIEDGAEGLGRRQSSAPSNAAHGTPSATTEQTNINASSQPLQPLQLARPQLAHSWRIQIQVEAQKDGGYRVGPGQDVNGPMQAAVLSVDRDGTLESLLPRPTHAKTEATQRELLISAAAALNENAVQVNAMQQSLRLGSDDPNAAFFIERTRHYHHEQKLSLREAAHAAAADVLRRTSPSSDFGFTDPREVHISGDHVTIKAQRESAAAPRSHGEFSATASVIPAVETDPSVLSVPSVPSVPSALSALKAHVDQFADQAPPSPAVTAPEPFKLIRSAHVTDLPLPPEQPQRSVNMPEQTSVAWLLRQRPVLIPGKQGVWVSEDWTDEQLLRLAEVLNGQVAITLIDGRPRLTSGTTHHVFVVPEFSFETGAPLRLVHLQPTHATEAEQVMARQFLALTRKTRPNARVPESAVIYRDAQGQAALQPYGPLVDRNSVRHYTAQSLQLEGAPGLSIAIRPVYRNSILSEAVSQAVVRISGLAGTPDIAQIRNAAHRIAQEHLVQQIRFEWDLEGASKNTYESVASNFGLSIEPRYHFDFHSYTNGQLLTWNEAINAPGSPYIKSAPEHSEPTKPILTTQGQLAPDPRVAAQVDKRLYGALLAAGPRYFEILLDLLNQPHLSPAQLTRRHNVKGKIEKHLNLLALFLTGINIQYKNVPAHITQFLKATLPYGVTAQSYLKKLVENPGHWAKSRGLLDATTRTRLNLFSQYQLEELRLFSANSYSLENLMHTLGARQEEHGLLLSVTSDLLHLLNPKVQTWQEMDLSYPGGLAALAKDVQAELELRATGQTRAVNYPALWRDSQFDGKERLSFKESAGWHLEIGSTDRVSAKLDAAQVRALTHTHPDGDVNAEARQPHSQDINALKKINALRRQTRLTLPLEQRERLSSVRYGPLDHHVAYFGLPDKKLPRNARLMNALGDARQTITQAVASSSKESLFIQANLPALDLKQLGTDTAIIRMGSFQPSELLLAFKAIRKWADQHPQLRTLRIESHGHDRTTLQKHLLSDAQQAHATVEESYDFDSGKFDLNHPIHVVSIALGESRAAADANAHQRQGVARAYALHTLYFAGNKTYDQPGRPGSVNLEKFLETATHGQPEQDTQDSTPRPEGAQIDSQIRVTFRSSNVALPLSDVVHSHSMTRLF